MFLSQGHVTKPTFEIEHGIKYEYQFYCTFLLNMKSLQFQVDLPETVSQRDRQWRVNLRKRENAQQKKKLKRASEWSWRMSASSWSIPLFLVTPLHQRTIVSLRFNLPFAPSEGQLAQETQEWEEAGVRTGYKMKSGEAKRRPSESPCFSSRPLMCCETGERRIERGMERRRRKALWGRCVLRSWGGFISCQRGVSLPANWPQRLKVSEVSERNREAEVPARWGGRFPRALFTLPLALLLVSFTLLSIYFKI